MDANYDTSKVKCQEWRRRLGVPIAPTLRGVLEFETILAAAFEKLGSTSSRELAQAIGLEGDYRKQRVDRWRDRGSADYEGTIRLLEYVGWLRVDAAGEATRPALAAPALAPVEAAEELMAAASMAAASAMKSRCGILPLPFCPPRPGGASPSWNPASG